eukprot:Sspe_Gene.24320::Locus_9615_Transcript_1_1_Confidence_1.000_Length_5785::g.24320::m.24320
MDAERATPRRRLRSHRESVAALHRVHEVKKLQPKPPAQESERKEHKPTKSTRPGGYVCSLRGGQRNVPGESRISIQLRPEPPGLFGHHVDLDAGRKGLVVNKRTGLPVGDPDGLEALVSKASVADVVGDHPHHCRISLKTADLCGSEIDSNITLSTNEPTLSLAIDVQDFRYHMLLRLRATVHLVAEQQREMERRYREMETVKMRLEEELEVWRRNETLREVAHNAAMEQLSQRDKEVAELRQEIEALRARDVEREKELDTLRKMEKIREATREKEREAERAMERQRQAEREMYKKEREAERRREAAREEEHQRLLKSREAELLQLSAERALREEERQKEKEASLQRRLERKFERERDLRWKVELEKALEGQNVCKNCEDRAQQEERLMSERRDKIDEAAMEEVRASEASTLQQFEEAVGAVEIRVDVRDDPPAQYFLGSTSPVLLTTNHAIHLPEGVRWGYVQGEITTGYIEGDTISFNTCRRGEPPSSRLAAGCGVMQHPETNEVFYISPDSHDCTSGMRMGVVLPSGPLAQGASPLKAALIYDDDPADTLSQLLSHFTFATTSHSPGLRRVVFTLVASIVVNGRPACKRTTAFRHVVVSPPIFGIPRSLALYTGAMQVMLLQGAVLVKVPSLRALADTTPLPCEAVSSLVPVPVQSTLDTFSTGVHVHLEPRVGWSPDTDFFTFGNPDDLLFTTGERGKRPAGAPRDLRPYTTVFGNGVFVSGKQVATIIKGGFGWRKGEREQQPAVDPTKGDSVKLIQMLEGRATPCTTTGILSLYFPSTATTADVAAVLHRIGYIQDDPPPTLLVDGTASMASTSCISKESAPLTIPHPPTTHPRPSEPRVVDITVENRSQEELWESTGTVTINVAMQNLCIDVVPGRVRGSYRLPLQHHGEWVVLFPNTRIAVLQQKARKLDRDRLSHRAAQSVHFAGGFVEVLLVTGSKKGDELSFTPKHPIVLDGSTVLHNGTDVGRIDSTQGRCLNLQFSAVGNATIAIAELLLSCFRFRVNVPSGVDPESLLGVRTVGLTVLLGTSKGEATLPLNVLPSPIFPSPEGPLILSRAVSSVPAFPFQFLPDLSFANCCVRVEVAEGFEDGDFIDLRKGHSEVWLRGASRNDLLMDNMVILDEWDERAWRQVSSVVHGRSDDDVAVSYWDRGLVVVRFRKERETELDHRRSVTASQKRQKQSPSSPRGAGKSILFPEAKDILSGLVFATRSPFPGTRQLQVAVHEADGAVIKVSREVVIEAPPVKQLGVAKSLFNFRPHAIASSPLLLTYHGEALEAYVTASPTVTVAPLSHVTLRDMESDALPGGQVVVEVIDGGTVHDHFEVSLSGAVSTGPAGSYEVGGEGVANIYPATAVDRPALALSLSSIATTRHVQTLLPEILFMSSDTAEEGTRTVHVSIQVREGYCVGSAVVKVKVARSLLAVGGQRGMVYRRGCAKLFPFPSARVGVALHSETVGKGAFVRLCLVRGETCSDTVGVDLTAPYYTLLDDGTLFREGTSIGTFSSTRGSIVFRASEGCTGGDLHEIVSKIYFTTLSGVGGPIRCIMLIVSDGELAQACTRDVVVDDSLDRPSLVLPRGRIKFALTGNPIPVAAGARVIYPNPDVVPPRTTLTVSFGEGYTSFDALSFEARPAVTKYGAVDTLHVDERGQLIWKAGKESRRIASVERSTKATAATKCLTLSLTEAPPEAVEDVLRCLSYQCMRGGFRDRHQVRTVQVTVRCGSGASATQEVSVELVGQLLNTATCVPRKYPVGGEISVLPTFATVRECFNGGVLSVELSSYNASLAVCEDDIIVLDLPNNGPLVREGDSLRDTQDGKTVATITDSPTGFTVVFPTAKRPLMTAALLTHLMRCFKFRHSDPAASFVSSAVEFRLTDEYGNCSRGVVKIDA